MPLLTAKDLRGYFFIHREQEMRHYEIMFLVHPDQSEQTGAMIERYRNQIESKSGVVHRLEDLGRRVLAYPIQKIVKAHYILMNIECDAQTLAEFETGFRFNDAILRFLTIRKNEAITEQSPLSADGKNPSKTFDYKDLDTLKAHINDIGKIVPARITGTSAINQRQLATAIKRARFLSLIPYTDQH